MFCGEYKSWFHETYWILLWLFWWKPVLIFCYSCFNWSKTVHFMLRKKKRITWKFKWKKGNKAKVFAITLIVNELWLVNLPLVLSRNSKQGHVLTCSLCCIWRVKFSSFQSALSDFNWYKMGFIKALLHQSNFEAVCYSWRARLHKNSPQFCWCSLIWFCFASGAHVHLLQKSKCFFHLLLKN